MLSMRLALYEYISGTDYIHDNNINVLDEDELNKDTPLPAVVIAYAGLHPYGKSAVFFRERWALYILTQPADYYTLGKIGSALRKDLNGATFDSMAGERDAALEVEWLLDGPTELDTVYNMHTQVQYYEIITQNY